MNPFEGSAFFTIFVMLQFWNLFNAKAYATKRSALHFEGCSGFLLIAGIIFVGQVLIGSFGRQFFNVVPLSISDWIWIVCITSPVLWIGELARIFTAKGDKND